MPRNQYLSEDLRERVVKAIKGGKTIAAISRDFSLAQSTVRNLYKRYEARGHCKTKVKSGRPRKTSVRIDRRIETLSRADPTLTAPKILERLPAETQHAVTARTVQRRLVDVGLVGRHGVRKPLISKKSKSARFDWARERIAWPLDKWSKVLWSDESKFCLFSSDGIKWVRRPVGARNNPRYHTPTVKHGGGSVMVWGCFSAKGVGPLVRVEGIMDRFKYAQILEQHMVPYARENLPRGWLFQQDNDPKHTSRYVKNQLGKLKVRVLPWPSQSPDLNPIEHLWDELTRRVQGQRASNATQKFAILEREWHNIDQRVIDKLLNSMSNRCTEVMRKKGLATRY